MKNLCTCIYHLTESWNIVSRYSFSSFWIILFQDSEQVIVVIIDQWLQRNLEQKLVIKEDYYIFFTYNLIKIIIIFKNSLAIKFLM